MNIRDLEYLVALVPSTAIFGVRQIPATLASRRLAGKFVSWKMSWA